MASSTGLVEPTWAVNREDIWTRNAGETGQGNCICHFGFNNAPFTMFVQDMGLSQISIRTEFVWLQSMSQPSHGLEQKSVWEMEP